jgi:hypothetical protein
MLGVLFKLLCRRIFAHFCLDHSHHVTTVINTSIMHHNHHRQWLHASSEDHEQQQQRDTEQAAGNPDQTSRMCPKRHAFDKNVTHLHKTLHISNAAGRQRSNKNKLREQKSRLTC